MRTRHRVPTIFNLYMVDVLCCALGCVILIWLVNMREAKQRADEAGETAKRLEATLTDLAALQQHADALQRQFQESTSQAATTRDLLLSAEDRARRAAMLLQTTQGDRDNLQTQLAQADKEIAALRARSAAAEERLVKQAGEYRDLEKKLTAVAQRAATLETQLREKDTLAGASARRADETAERLRDAEVRAKELRTQADLVPGLRAEGKSSRDKLTAAEARLLALEKEMASRKQELLDANYNLASLQGEKKSLQLEVSRARAAADNRFAGIALTGRRVVFVVDMSGSMELVDEKTPAPDKWTGVRETLARIMRSLPDLEKFQVILFAEKATYLLGQEEHWLNYDSRTSAERVVQALTAVKPKGGTNMYAALEAAFRFQPTGLDTIYLLSDGLPNLGEGLIVEAGKTLRETEKAELLGKHIRKKLLTDWNRVGAGRVRVRINAVGFFYESPDVGAFLWALARENDGSFVGMSKP